MIDQSILPDLFLTSPFLHNSNSLMTRIRPEGSSGIGRLNGLGTVVWDCKPQVAREDSPIPYGVRSQKRNKKSASKFSRHIFSLVQFNQSNSLDLSDRNCLSIMSNDSLERKKKKEKRKTKNEKKKKRKEIDNSGYSAATKGWQLPFKLCRKRPRELVHDNTSKRRSIANWQAPTYPLSKYGVWST